MDAQNFFNEQLEIVDIYTSELSEIAKDFGQAMVDKNYKTEEEAENAIKNGELSENELDLYYKFGIISNDYKIQRSKLLDFVYFCNILNIEIDISNIKNTKGLLEFSKEYLPYKTFNIITPEKKIKVENLEYYNERKKDFIKILLSKK